MQQIIPVFIASPSDVPNERSLAEAAIRDLSPRLLSLFDVALQVVSWEDFAPIAAPTAGRTFQDDINLRLERSGVFLGILNRRWGTAVGAGAQVSGTEMEFDLALKSRERIKILTYFRRDKRRSVPRRDVHQSSKLDAFKKKLRGHDLPYHEYEGETDFKERIDLDLLEAVLQIITDVRRRDYLRSFFRFGIARERWNPSFLVAYPPIHKHLGRGAQPHSWHERLLPNVVYEDFKAIQKVEAALRLVGVSDLRSVTPDYPGLTDPGNRVWLCLPRNHMGQARLRELGRRVRFEFGEDGEHRFIDWRRGPRARPIRVYSPLHKYLERQRPAGRRRWDAKFGKILARDYAVLSRFSSPEGTYRAAQGRPFWHYFVAGIRGLGTWGAGWFIAHRAERLAGLVKERSEAGGDVQLLLEVTYRDHWITDVRDVSGERQGYFDGRYANSYVAEEIAEHRARRADAS